MQITVVLGFIFPLALTSSFIDAAITQPPPGGNPPPSNGTSTNASSPTLIVNPKPAPAPEDSLIGLPPPGGSAIGSCSEQKPCPNAHWECVDGRCLCAEGYSPANDGTCVKGPELGEPCRMNGNDLYCHGFGVDISCPQNDTSAVCVCKLGYEPAGQSCKPAVRGIGASCNVDGDCTAAFATCQKGKCACVEGFKAGGKDGLCVPTDQNCPGNGKASQQDGQARVCQVQVNLADGTMSNDTCPTGYICFPWQNSFTADSLLVGHCCPAPTSPSNSTTVPCPVGVAHKTGKCPDTSQIPADAPIPANLGPLCPLGAGYECYVGRSCCPSPCHSSSSHFNYAGQCYDRVILEQPCQIDSQCLPNSQCTGGICRCSSGYAKTSSTLCEEVGSVQRAANVTAPPPSPPPTAALPPNPPAPAHEGENECGEQKACRDPRTTCIDGHCLCAPGFIPGSATGSKEACVKAPRLGEPCKVGGQKLSCYGFGVDDCPENGTACVCKPGYQSEGNTCAAAVRLVGDACSTDGNCTAAFSVCKDGKCSCAEGFKPDDLLCTPTEFHCVGNDKPLEVAGKVVACGVMLTDSGDITNDTCPAGHFCNYWPHTFGVVQQSLAGHCCPKPPAGGNTSATSCPVGAHHKTARCRDYSKGEGAADMPEGATMCPFSEGYDCHNILLCCPVPCRSSPTHFHVNGRCYDTVSLNEPCEVNPQCVLGAECSGTCRCKDGYVNVTANSCVAKSFLEPGGAAGAPRGGGGAGSGPTLAQHPPSESIRSGQSVDSPPATATADSCSAAKPCPDAQHRCVDGACICADGFTLDEKGGCTKSWAELGDPCRVNGKQLYCVGFGVDPSCSSSDKCECEDGHEPASGKTCKLATRLVDTPCKVDGECTVAFSRCQNGRCACIDGFRPDVSGMCQPTEFNCIGDETPLVESGQVRMCDVSVTDAGGITNDTCPAGHFCNYWQNSFTASGSLAGHCCPLASAAGNQTSGHCPLGEPHKTGQCIDLSNRPADAPIPAEIAEKLCPYAAGYECLNNRKSTGPATCCPLPCLASSSHFHVNGRCYDRLLLDQPCDIDAQCMTRSQCRSGVCKCKPGHVQEGNTLCLAPEK